MNPNRETQARVTELLSEASDRDDAWQDLLPLVYEELRTLAQRLMGSERMGHTLQATALVHEAWVRLSGDEELGWSNRRHFYGAAARAMQRVLVDHARRTKAQKRGGDRARLAITAAIGFAGGDEDDPERVLALSDAVEALERDDPRAAEVARLRFYAGLEVAETAAALDVSERTVMREWAFARARLTELLAQQGEEAEPS